MVCCKSCSCCHYFCCCVFVYVVLLIYWPLMCGIKVFRVPTYAGMSPSGFKITTHTFPRFLHCPMQVGKCVGNGIVNYELLKVAYLNKGFASSEPAILWLVHRPHHLPTCKSSQALSDPDWEIFTNWGNTTLSFPLPCWDF